jgi:spore germination protein YaaH
MVCIRQTKLGIFSVWCVSICIFEVFTKNDIIVPKKYFIPFFILLTFFSVRLTGQQHPSIHQIEYEKHKDLPRKPSSFDVSGAGIIPYHERSRGELTATVFGYFPYWKYPEAVSNMHFDLLSHISVFDFTVQSNGNISTPSAWPWTDLINAAHEAGVKIILTAVNFNGDQIHSLLFDTVIKQNFFNNLKSLIETYDLQGVNIDFENIRQSDRGEVLNGFMADLTAYLHEEIPGTEISIAVLPINWGGWEFAGLAEACDYLFIMGYNFYGPWSQTSGPCAPLTGGSYNITRTVNTEFAEAAENNADKLILGVPYYGNKWKTNTGNPYSHAYDHISQPTYSLAKNIADDHGALWDDISQTSYCSYQENGSWYQVWYDSDTSLRRKYDLADSKNYKGIGMWALGYDSDKPELWDEIRRRYTEASAVEEFYRNQIEISSVSTEGGSLKIRFSAEANEQITLVLSSVMGQIVYRTDFKTSFPGFQLSEIPVMGLPRGIYIVKVLLRDEGSLKSGVRKVFIR